MLSLRKCLKKRLTYPSETNDSCMAKSATIKDGQYQLKLPFKKADMSVPNNRGLVEQ